MTKIYILVITIIKLFTTKKIARKNSKDKQSRLNTPVFVRSNYI